MIYRRRYLLPRWAHYVEDRDDLREDERISAALLFRALSKMPGDDVAFLAEKYQTHVKSQGAVTEIPLTDKVLAAKHGLSQYDYRMKRVKIEKKLQRLISTEQSAFEKHRVDNLEEFKLMLGLEYLVGFDIQSRGYTHVIVTSDPDKATIYKDLPHYGIDGALVKVPVKGWEVW